MRMPSQPAIPSPVAPRRLAILSPATRLPTILMAALLLWPLSLHAQKHSEAMTDAEAEKIREYAYQPDQRVGLFLKFMESRIADIQRIATAKRINQRGEQLHDLMEQFSSLADELDDNLDDYQPKHWDVRKSLRKLIDASDKWAPVLQQPPDDPAYEVTRKLALEATRDIHETASNLLKEQTAWFAANPPEKIQDGPLIIPR